MKRLKKTELRNLFDFLHEVYALRDLDTFGPDLMCALPRIFSCDIYSYNEVNPERQRLSVVMEPDVIPRADLRIFEKYMHQHPLINYYRRTGDGRALKISDFLGRRQFHRLDLYNEYYRVHKIENQLAIVMPAPSPLVVGVVLNRIGRDFTERDRLRLEILRPHIAAAYKNAEVFTALRQSLGRNRNTTAIEIKAGRARKMTREAGQWLTKYFGQKNPAQPDGRLPGKLRQWVEEEEGRQGGAGGIPAPPRTLSLAREDGYLTVRLVSGGGASILIMEEILRDARQEEMKAFGLTGQEARILRWLGLGKTNKEIGEIEGISHRTVQKHLEHIYAKLGVKTRIAAAASVASAGAAIMAE